MISSIKSKDENTGFASGEDEESGYRSFLADKEAPSLNQQQPNPKVKKNTESKPVKQRNIKNREQILREQGILVSELRNKQMSQSGLSASGVSDGYFNNKQHLESQKLL